MKPEEYILVVVKRENGKKIKRLALTRVEFNLLKDVLSKIDKIKKPKDPNSLKEYEVDNISPLYKMKVKYRKNEFNINYIEFIETSKKGKK